MKATISKPYRAYLLSRVKPTCPNQMGIDGFFEICVLRCSVSIVFCGGVDIVKVQVLKILRWLAHQILVCFGFPKLE